MPSSSYRPQSLRQAVFAYIEATDRPLTAREIAIGLNIDYKRVVDALTALFDHMRIERHGRKYSARWARLKTDGTGSGWKELESHWHGKALLPSR